MSKDLSKANESKDDNSNPSRLGDIDSLGDLLHHLIKASQFTYSPPTNAKFKKSTQKERANYLKEYIVGLWQKY